MWPTQAIVCTLVVFTRFCLFMLQLHLKLKSSSTQESSKSFWSWNPSMYPWTSSSQRESTSNSSSKCILVWSPRMGIWARLPSYLDSCYKTCTETHVRAAGKWGEHWLGSGLRLTKLKRTWKNIGHDMRKLLDITNSSVRHWQKLRMVPWRTATSHRRLRASCVRHGQTPQITGGSAKDLLGSTVLHSYHTQVTVSGISHQMKITQVTVSEIPNLVLVGKK